MNYPLVQDFKEVLRRTYRLYKRPHDFSKNEEQFIELLWYKDAVDAATFALKRLAKSFGWKKIAYNEI